MKKNQTVILFVCMLVSVGILAVLYLFSPLNKKIHRASFQRQFINTVLKKSRSIMDLEVNSFYFSGFSEDRIYLGNTTAPFNLLTSNLSLTDSAHVILQTSLDSVINPSYFKVAVTPPDFYLMNGFHPIILKGDTNNWKADSFIQDSGYYFTDAITRGVDEFVLKSYSNETKGYELAKKNVNKFIFNNELLEKQIDGLFCVDGKLLFNQKHNRFIYLYFYRNQFIIADTNLNLKYRSNTIDTFSRARIRVAKIGYGEESMLSGPQAAINGLSCTHGDFLYVQSNLLAKNEDASEFKSSSTIDCYRIEDGLYIGSFHVPHFKKERLVEFQVINDKLFALYGRYLISYYLDTNLLGRAKS